MPRTSASSERSRSQEAYHEAQSGSSPSLMRYTVWCVSAASCRSSASRRSRSLDIAWTLRPSRLRRAFRSSGGGDLALDLVDEIEMEVEVAPQEVDDEQEILAPVLDRPRRFLGVVQSQHQIGDVLAQREH